MSERKIEPRKDIEFEWLNKARRQMIDAVMNATTDIEYFKFRLIQDVNEPDFEATKLLVTNSIKDKEKELAKVEHVYKVIDEKIKGYK